MAAHKLDIIGQQFTSLKGETVTVVDYLNYSSVTIEFEDGTQVIRNLQYIRTGSFDRRVVNGRTVNNKRLYHAYSSMYARCYNIDRKLKHKSYAGCTISEEWGSTDLFVLWALDQPGSDKEDWQLDKDILVKGNRVYGPDTCCFVPFEINVAFTKSNAKRGYYPIGVRKASRGNKFTAQIGGTKIKTHLGTFDTPEQAFAVYKIAKEDQIKALANKYKEDLDPRVYEALLAYQVEITD